jgi:sulfatase modifying factor 1
VTAGCAGSVARGHTESGLQSNKATTLGSKTEDMVWIRGGAFQMGSDRHYPEEAPVSQVRIDGFFIDPLPITNRQFAAFVAATNYRTVAERGLDPSAFPDVAPDLLRPGSMMFQPPRGPVDLRDVTNWWTWKRGAYWRHPEGRGSSVAERLNHPVVHIAFEDAATYARWCGKALPAEAEWEFAARGGLDGAEFAWGHDFAPDGVKMAHTWEGEFPWQNRQPRGLQRTSPVGYYPPNGYGLFDMIGNVWEWTTDWFANSHRTPAETPCCVPDNPRGGCVDLSYDPAQPTIRIPRKVVKGGSFLCAASYCRRYRPAARHAQMIDSGMSHIGFRCVFRPQSKEERHGERN